MSVKKKKDIVLKNDLKDNSNIPKDIGGDIDVGGDVGGDDRVIFEDDVDTSRDYTKKVNGQGEWLTPRNKAFLDEWLVNGGNGTWAYQQVYKGVDPVVARSNSAVVLAKKSAQAYIQPILRKIAKEEKIERSYVVQTIKQTIIDCQNDGDRKNLLKALDLLCKIGGLYIPVNPINLSIASGNNGDISISFGGFDPDKQTEQAQQKITLTNSTQPQDIHYEDVTDISEG